MKGRHRIGLGPDFACIEGLARGAWQARVLSRDPSSDPLTGEVRVHGGPAGEHIEPLYEQSEFTQPICLRLGRVRRRHSVEALPPSWKDVRGGKGRLPAIEIRPREIRSGGCHRRPVDQPTFMIPEAGQSLATSQQKIIDQLAQQIVSLMEAPW
jgi:hypothetical protein